MSLVRAPLSCPVAPPLRGAVAVMGNLDGVHRGHQALLDEARDIAEARGAPVAAVTFEPHPRMVFRPDDPPFLLTTLAQKAEWLEAYGCETVFALPFTDVLRSLDADRFVDEILIRALGIAGVVVGEDFAFGHGRSGSARTLALHDPGRLTARSVAIKGPPGGPRYSSTAARTALREGRPEEAEAILGRPFAVRSTVLEGRRLARQLDFPTANLSLGPLLRPAYGAYVVTVGIGDGVYPGIANLGLRPTVDGKTERLEAHLFGFEGDLYGKEIEVGLRHFLRPEIPFEDVAALKAQIAKDVGLAHAWHARQP